MDGREVEIDTDAVEVVVTMADRTRHLYRESADRGTSPLIYVGRIGAA